MASGGLFCSLQWLNMQHNHIASLCCMQGHPYQAPRKCEVEVLDMRVGQNMRIL